ncbi:MAG: hypothetical protein IT286_01190 [Proteobacteria bacterium]|nr:hypothetical protein [Pseudomonadota bacterium]
MTTKISAAIGILFFSTAALAEKAYEFEYQIRKSSNGQVVSEGSFVAVDGRTNEVQIKNPASSLSSLNLSINNSFKTTMPGGDGVDLIETKISAPGIRIQTAHDLEGNATFGDGKINGEVKIKRIQSFYFQNASGVSLDFNGHKIQNGTCVGGNIQSAARQVLSFDSETIVTEDSIEFNRVVMNCVSYSDEPAERGGYVCAEWQKDVQHIVLPACSN